MALREKFASVMCGEVGKLCVNKMYRRGPKTLPCGETYLIGWGVESEFSISTEYCLLGKIAKVGNMCPLDEV